MRPAAAEGAYAEAADLLASMGEQPVQARLRLLATRRLAAEGRLADAEQQLNLACVLGKRGCHRISA